MNSSFIIGKSVVLGIPDKGTKEQPQNSASNIVLSVGLKADNSVIGKIALTGIQLLNRNCELKFFLNENSQARIAEMAEAGQLMIKHAYENLNLHRIDIKALADESWVIALAERLGFKKEAVRREAVLGPHSPLDLYEYGQLKSEWKATSIK